MGFEWPDPLGLNFGGFFQILTGCMILADFIQWFLPESRILWDSEKNHQNLVSDNGNTAYLYVAE